MNSAGDGEPIGKAVLVELSHAIERFALAARPAEPLAVVAMFQKLSYFEREAGVYGTIAGRGAVTVVGLAEDLPPRLPAGVRHALVPPGDELTREWSVTVLGPRGGATLVAVDQETVDPAARTLEAGRLFRGRWSFRRADAYRELLRLRTRLRMPAGTVEEIDEVLLAVLGEPEPAHQDWWDVPLRFLADRMERATRERDLAEVALEAVREAEADDGPERDPHTGLHTERFLARWTAGLGAGTLPIGLALLRVPGVAGLRTQYGMRAELAVLQGIAGCVRELVTDRDRVIRLGEQDFLAVLPSWPLEEVQRLCDRMCARVGRLGETYPFVALPGTAAATVTRERPLPIPQLVEQVGRETVTPG